MFGAARSALVKAYTKGLRTSRRFYIVYASRTAENYIPLDNCLRNARILISEKRFSEAERFLSNALAIHFKNTELTILLALSAHEAGQFAQAAARWSRMRSRWPGIAQAWVGLAASHRELGDLRKALPTIKQAIQRFPHDLSILVESARLLPYCDNVLDRNSLWQDMMSARPHSNDAEQMSSCLQLLHELAVAISGHHDDDDRGDLRTHDENFAARVGSDLEIIKIGIAALDQDFDRLFSILEKYVARYGGEPIVTSFLTDEGAVELGHAAAHRRFRKPDLSRIVLGQIAGRYADNPHWWWLYIETLLLLGRLDEASVELDRQKPRFQGITGFMRNSGVLAMKRENWGSALEHFAAHQAVHPHDPVVSDLIARTKLEQAAAHHEAGTVTLATLRQDVGTEVNDPVRSLLLGFESLGDDCEFGLVQRRFEAEPIGLFRWNSTSSLALIECLDAGLLGLGEPENTVMSTFEDQEYYLSDKRWGFGFHTFRTAHEIQADKLFPNMCKRMSYLREKFVADLREGHKVFVFKSLTLDVPIARALHRSLRAYGSARLLWVTTVDAARVAMTDDEPSAGIYQADEGLFIGLLSRFGNQPGQWDIAFDEWIALCRCVDGTQLPMLQPTLF